MERAPLGFCLMLRTPPGTPATHVRPRPGHEHGPGTTPSIFVEPPINAFTPMRATSRRRPVRSSPRPRPPDGTGSPSAFPRASHPADRTDDARQGRGQAIEHGPGTTRSTHISRSSNPVVHSLRATSRRTRRPDESLRVVDCVVARLPLHQGPAARITMFKSPSSSQRSMCFGRGLGSAWTVSAVGSCSRASERRRDHPGPASAPGGGRSICGFP